MVFCPYLLRPPGALGAIKNTARRKAKKAGPLYADSVGSQTGPFSPAAELMRTEPRIFKKHAFFGKIKIT